MGKWSLSLVRAEMLSLGFSQANIDSVSDDNLMIYARKIRAKRRKLGMGRVIIEKKKKPIKKEKRERLTPEEELKKKARLYRKFTRIIAEDENLDIEKVREALSLKAFEAQKSSEMKAAVKNAWEEWKVLND